MLGLSKRCGQCDEAKAASEFHKRAASVDGLAACCKECQSKYDRKRLNKPDRVESRRQYKTTEVGKALIRLGQYAWIDRNSEKRQAHNAVSNAVRDGVLIKQPCEVCGELKVHAHHDDYSKKLEVRWLCNQHHIEHHMRERDAQTQER